MLPDLDAGATGAMASGGYPDGIRLIVDAYAAGQREKAIELYRQWLALTNYANRQGGSKGLIKEAQRLAPRGITLGKIGKVLTRGHKACVNNQKLSYKLRLAVKGRTDAL